MNRKFAYIFILLSLLLPRHSDARPADDERRVMVGIIDAVDLFAQGEYKDASRIFSNLIRRYPDDDALNYYMSLCTIADYKVANAIFFIEKAVELDSTNFIYRHRLAQIYAVTKDYDKAIAQYERLKAERPYMTELQDELGEVYLHSGRFSEYYPIAYSYMGEEGLSEEDKLRYLSGVFGELSREEFRSRRPLADSLYVKLTRQYPESSNSLVSWTKVLAWLGDWEALDRYASEGAARFPQDTTLCHYSAASKYFRKDYEGAAKMMEKLVVLQKDEPQKQLSTYSWLGDVYYKAGKSAQCFKAYDRALALDPGYVPVLNNYAYFLSLQKKNLKKALAMSEKTILAEPDNVTYLDTYGWILYLLGRPEEARMQFNHAKLYGGNDNAVILDHFATVLYELGEYRLAYSYWEKALSKMTEDEKEEVKDLEQKIAAARDAIQNGHGKKLGK
ncbi:MAG: tetratricopeptide repeat protein [Bacteroidales bacterium]|nr:tetratricopeptide repeat protein [Bacteroidales bacterium]